VELAFLLSRLREKRALIVHFSHHQNMREGGVFPDDLVAAIKHKDDWALSCSVIWPGHNMSPVGSVGVIFEPASVGNILSVCNADSGSSSLGNGEDGSLGHPLSSSAFENSFCVEDYEYNEWRLCGATAKGIFVTDTTNIYVKREISVNHPYGSGVIKTIAAERISFGEVSRLAQTLNLPVYTMGADGPEPVLS
jgi:hypothetical protein